MKRLYFIAIFLFLSYTNQVRAEITIPYILDDKPQILFGDSTLISATSTYQGLENYAPSYVGNYLHITFTYTHVRFAFSDYPPRLYITSEDPRATTTPGEKDRSVVYQLMPIPIPPGHETDWYAYDIQFDAAGYNVSVIEAGTTSVASFHKDIPGLTNTDWVALANLYSNSGNVFSMALTPLPVYGTPMPVVPTATTTPVIIVPGIMSTKLYENNNLIWLNVIQIVSSISDNFLDVLSMDVGGLPINNSILPGGVIRSLNNADYFDNLFNQLISANYQENIDIFEHPYDWRFGVEDIVLKLKDRIEEIKAERGVDKVDLVAHSMGGLVVKEYLKDYGGSSVGKFIDIATPHAGAPSAYKVLMYGDNLGVKKLFGLVNINANEIKQISQNMPSVYELLPSSKYFDDYGPYVVNLTAGTERYDFAGTKNYLKSEGRNALLVDRAEAFHQAVDDIDPATYGVTAYNIVGCGTPTLGGFYIIQGGDHPIYNIRYVNGDGTVPIRSAQALTASSTYYVSGAVHALMPSTSGVKELISDLLTSTSTVPDISPYPNLATNESGCTMPDGRIVSFHSPVTLDVYDASNNHAGPNVDGDIENDIPGVDYEELGDNKFAFLPTGTEYSVKGNGTGEGTFDLRIQDVVDGEVATTTLWTDVPVTSSTHVAFTMPASGPVPPTITLDNNNDGVYEQALNYTLASAGVVESTGKVAKILGPTSSSGGRTNPEPKRVIVVATTTPVFTATTTTPLVAPGPLPVVVQKSPVATTTLVTSSSASSEPPYQNTAVVYKSFNEKVKSLFAHIWYWLTNGF